MYDVSCNLCGSSETRLFFDRTRDREDVRNVICGSCGLVYISPRPRQREVNALCADGQFSIQARGASEPSRAKIGQSELAALRRFRLLVSKAGFMPMGGGNVLEIGCGLGSFVRLMRAYGWEVNGIEPDTNYAKFGSRLYNIPIFADFYEERLHPQASFDVVCAFHVIEHVNSPRRFLAKIKHELKPGGLIYLENPCIERPRNGDLAQFFWSAHLHTFSRNTLTGLLRQTGFEPLHIGHVGNALWVLARKLTDPVSTRLMYPLDDPNRLYSQTHQLHKRFRSRQKRGSAFDLLCRAVVKLKTNPLGFVSASVTRFLERAASHPKSPVLHVNRVLRGKPVAHFRLKDVSNAGDRLLFDTVQSVLSGAGCNWWSNQPMRRAVSAETIDHLNRSTRGVVVGGGGLFLKDTNPNQRSGWQWPCGADELRRLEVPLIVFAVGYNRFRGQEDFDPIFTPSVRALVSQAAFVGLRNLGSINSVAKYLTEEQADRLVWQPCPTTVLAKLYPGFVRDSLPSGRRVLAINAAFDRHGLRFDGGEQEILTAIARAVKAAQSDGWRIKLAIHSPLDATTVAWLLRERVDFEEVDLTRATPRRILRFYRDVSLTIGMRGHAQMIPFGLGNAILSLVSHNKLKWFLDDVGHPEWGIEVQSPDLEETLTDRIRAVGERLNEVRNQIRQAQDELWAVTQRNLQTISRVLS